MKVSNQQRGTALVEFAILLPLLLLIAFGITEFGRAIYVYNTLVKASRDAARYYSNCCGSGADSTHVGYIQNLAVYGNTAGTGASLAPGLTTSMVFLCDQSTCPATHFNQGTVAPKVNLVTVTISGYPFQSLVPFATANLTTITFGDISTTMLGNLE
jgi:Flp pilus assembly protein TadG